MSSNNATPSTYQSPLTDLFGEVVATGTAKVQRAPRQPNPVRQEHSGPLLDILDREAMAGKPMIELNEVELAYRWPVWKRPKGAGRAMEKHIEFKIPIWGEDGKIMADVGVIRFRGGRGLSVQRYYAYDMGYRYVTHYSVMILAFDKDGNADRVPMAVYREFVTRNGGNGIHVLEGTISPSGRLEFGNVGVPIPNHWRRHMRRQNLKNVTMRGIDWVVGNVQWDMKPFDGAVLPRYLNKNKEQIDNKKMYLPYNLKPKDRQKVLDFSAPVDPNQPDIDYDALAKLKPAPF